MLTGRRGDGSRREEGSWGGDGGGREGGKPPRLSGALASADSLGSPAPEHAHLRREEMVAPPPPPLTAVRLWLHRSSVLIQT